MYLTRFRFNTARRDARRLLSSPNRLHGAVNAAFPDPPSRDGNGPRVLWRIDPAPAGRIDLLISSPHSPDLTHLVEQAGWPSLGGEGWSTFAYGEFLDGLGEGDQWAFRLTANPVHYIRRKEDAPGSATKRAAHMTPRHQIGWLLKHQERAGFAVLRSRIDHDALSTVTPAGCSEADTGGEIAVRVAQSVRRTEAGIPQTGDQQGYEVVVHTRSPVRFGKEPDENGPAPTNARFPSDGRTHSGPLRSSASDVRFAQATFDGRLQITDLTAFRRTLTQGLGKAKAYGCGLMTLAPVR
ncbi:type I-E CRISPR-associated protein Cas6/Cse3/CasE [Streptomyces sp. NPDC055078]